MAALQVINNKRNYAQLIKDECMRHSAGNSPKLTDLLNFLLDPEKDLKEAEKLELLEWCRELVAGGISFKEYEKTVRQYNNATVCGLVWTSNFVAYRCRTCAKSPCMSLCADCFHAGNHEGHDHNMFRSQAGGACDCGDPNVLNSSGFCPHHGPERAKKCVSAPLDLVAIPRCMMPRLLYRLLLHFRQHFDDRSEEALKFAAPLVEFLRELSDMGAEMRRIITSVGSSQDTYRQLMIGAASSSSELERRSLDQHILALSALSAPDVPSDFRGVEGLDTPLIHETILDELVFWMVKLEFPQELVTFLLGILPDTNYRNAFTKSFIKHYSRIFTMLIKSTGRKERQVISNRIVHISVQLLSPQDLALKMVMEDKLLYIMLSSLKYMMQLVLINVDSVTSFHTIVDCNNDVLKDHCYWPIVSDIINVLSHKQIAQDFMSDDRLLHFWFELISYFQGMNTNKRELITHVEFEPDSYYAAFSAELEICSSPMWSMLAHMKDPETADFSHRMIRIITEELEDWFEVNNIDAFMLPNTFEISFHLPLHRYLATFLANAVSHQGLELAPLLPTHEMLKMLMIHPLHIQVIFTEIFAGMWVRNGLQIRGQAMTYVQCHFANSMIDADLFMLQICASKLDPDYFVSTVLDRYHALELLTFGPYEDKVQHAFFGVDHHMPMTEGGLSLLCTLLDFTAQIGMNPYDVTRRDMVTLLCMSDRTHSQLMDMMPEKCGLTAQNKDFDEILKQVADYRQPNFEAGGGMQQGMYVPKGSVWLEEFDPLHAQLRAMHRRDYQGALDRFAAYVKNHGLYNGAASPWPPFRLPGPIHPAYSMLRKILHCRTMHGVIFTLLYRALNDKNCSDSMLYLTIYILELAVSLPNPLPNKQPISIGSRHDKKFQTWYASDCIFTNMAEIIPEVMVTLHGEAAVKELQLRVPQEDLESPELLDASGYQLAPSAISSSSSFLTTSSSYGPQSALVAMPSGATPEILRAVHAMLNEATNQVEAVTSLMDESCSHSSEAGTNTRSTGVSVNLNSIKTTKPQPVNESIITLLVKLHSRLSMKTNSYVPESYRQGTSSSDQGHPMVGDGPHFIGKLLDTVCRQSGVCNREVTRLYQELIPQTQTNKGKRKDMSDKEERRKKAQERQKKLMAEFANKQKEFMEKVINETSDMDLDEEDAAVESPLVEEKTYCVICNQTTPSSNERPMCLVTLVQPSSVLGHRRHTTDSCYLPVNEKMNLPVLQTCAKQNDERLATLMAEFDETSCLMAVNIGWKGGVFAQTCGHHVHLSCQASYIESLKTQQQSGIQTSKGEYWCPLCRQLANAILPISPGPGPALSQLTPPTPRHMINRIRDMLKIRPLTAGSSVLTLAMHQVMEDIHQVTYQQYKQYAKTQSAESILLFVCSVLRANLELEILQRQGHLCLPPLTLAPKKSCLLPLYQVLSLHSKMVTPQPFTNLWRHLTGVCDTNLEPGTTVSLLQNEVPVLLKDATALFIELLLSMPATLEKEIFQCLVHVVYNLVYVQALTYMSCRFAEEERHAWSTTPKQSVCDGLHRWMSVVIPYLSRSPLYDDDVNAQSGMLSICQSVWSPQSVETGVQEFCLPFLQNVSLLQHHLYGETLPQVSTSTIDIQEEFNLLAHFLGMLPGREGVLPSRQGVLLSGSQQGVFVESSACLRWYCDIPQQLVLSWCQHFVQYAKRQPDVARGLLSSNPSWYTPQLISLPRNYNDIFQYYRKQKCSKCNNLPQEPAICLVCGQLICFKQDCCKTRHLTEHVLESVQHSVECGASTGMFLIVNSSLVIVVRGSRVAIWGSVYLDEHGEEDKDLRRGKPLYLSEARYKMLHHQWLTMAFDHVCKRWIFHQGKL